MFGKNVCYGNEYFIGDPQKMILEILSFVAKGQIIAANVSIMDKINIADNVAMVKGCIRDNKRPNMPMPGLATVIMQ
jgi:hypothetical protein